MEKITYGAPRLVDWVAQIKAGAATVRAHFTGGALTSYGVTPAEYTTDSPFIQKVIEQSAYYKEGRIIRLRTTTIPDPVKPKVSKATPQQPRKQVSEVPDSTSEAPAPAKSDEAAVKQTEEGQSTKEVAEFADGVRSDPTIVEVSCLQDAQAYLQEHFNTASYKVRSYEAAQRAASEHGVQFIGAKFDTMSDNETTEAEE